MAASEDACFIKTFRAKIVPERLRSFVMPADGIVSNWIPADGRVQKDTIIATVNEDEIELERKELEVKISEGPHRQRGRVVKAGKTA